MRIGIVTFWNTQENYGQMLQLYAMQFFLKKIGHSPYLIRYDDKLDMPLMYEPKTNIERFVGVLKNPQKIFQYLQLKVKERQSRTSLELNNRRFDDFRAKYIAMSDGMYSSLKELQENPPVADAYLCGSDMIWNENVCKGASLLDFGDDKILKIAYAPSFASSTVSELYVEKIAPYLKKFYFIGTRERSGVEICQRAGYPNAKWMPDPTLLLEKSDYRSISIFPSTQKKYIFIYLLGHETQVSLQELYNFAEKENLEVVYIASQGRIDKYEKQYASIEEWLGYLGNAEYVFTNSFHCCVLSIIHNKNFLFLPLKGGVAKNNERIFSLLESAKLQDRILRQDIREVQDAVDWNAVNELLACQKERVLSEMKSVLRQ